MMGKRLVRMWPLYCVLAVVLYSRLAAAGHKPVADAIGEPELGDSHPRLEFVFEEMVTLGHDIKVGETPRGHRNITPITGGTVRGPGVKGQVLPGGWDWQLIGAQCIGLEANYFIEAVDGAVINVVNKGTWCSKNGTIDSMTLTTPVFEAPTGRYEWLNHGAYVGTAEYMDIPQHPAVRIKIFRAVL